ncbi:MAG: calcium/sodium antiporter [Nanoarchaeota archaeon]|nr:calcium/sodium antiporter [Nanoarchaeota archaeon]
MLDFLYFSILSSVIVLIIGLAVLIKSADHFTGISEKIGHILGIPQFIVGITIVSIGTSIPELATSIVAVFSRATEFVVANAVGSNITNILLVGGVAALLTKGLKVKDEILRVDIPLIVGSALLITFLLWDGVFSFMEAVFCLILYTAYIINIAKSHLDKKKIKEHFEYKWILVLFVSIVGIYLGAKFSVDAVNALTIFLGFSDTSIIAITIVALGTSLPELMVSVMAAIKKNFDMSIGNIIGSNVFNSFVVIGVPGLFTALKVSRSTILMGLPLMMIATLLISFAAIKKKLSRIEGVMYLIFYLIFIFLIYYIV